MNIEKVEIMVGDGPDLLILHSDLPPTMPKVDIRRALFKTEVEKGNGLRYARLHFPRARKRIIDARTGEARLVF
jgi:hypothetical protein